MAVGVVVGVGVALLVAVPDDVAEGVATGVGVALLVAVDDAELGVGVPVNDAKEADADDVSVMVGVNEEVTLSLAMLGLLDAVPGNTMGVADMEGVGCSLNVGRSVCVMDLVGIMLPDAPKESEEVADAGDTLPEAEGVCDIDLLLVRLYRKKSSRKVSGMVGVAVAVNDLVLDVLGDVPVLGETVPKGLGGPPKAYIPL